MKTPLTYYGGKQKLLPTILPLIPEHNLYCEPFVGGGAVFWAKDPSAVEVINDTNQSLINFYRQVQNNFVDLEKKIRISLHSRDLHRRATVIYENPDMFTELDQAWSVWLLAAQSFSGMLDGSFGYDVAKNTTSKKIRNKRNSFTEDLAIRLQNVQIECTDALRIIQSRDTINSFFYVDPPYVGSNCGHYDGYTQEDFDMLLKALSGIKGKFLLSSYPNKSLDGFVKENGWYQMRREMELTASGHLRTGRKKIEVLTANFPLPE